MSAGKAEDQHGTKEKALKQKWGEAYSRNISRVQAMAQEVAGKLGQEQVYGFLDKVVDGKKLGDHPMMIDFFHYFSSLMNEDKLLEGMTSQVKEPQELQAEYEKFQSNPALYDRSHPKHEEVVRDRNKLAQRLWPNKL